MSVELPPRKGTVLVHRKPMDDSVNVMHRHETARNITSRQ
jgi:hypothetical protein